MTDDEIMAIWWHMAGFDLAFQSPESRANYGSATERCPLLAIIKAAVPKMVLRHAYWKHHKRKDKH